MSAIIGELSIELADGTILRARTDIELASKWAAAEFTADEWAAMSWSQRNVAIAGALGALRRAAGEDAR